MSDSLQPCGLQPSRFLCPWDSPGKNTGVGCHLVYKINAFGMWYFAANYEVNSSVLKTNKKRNKYKKAEVLHRAWQVLQATTLSANAQKA